jgi:predicted Holliday junction resolvase-like endonuclease
MNTLTIILVMLAIIVIMGGVIYALIRDRKAQKKEIQELKIEINSARENVRQLSEYIKNSDKIRKEEKEIAEKIKEAKTDEEVHNIINDIIALNNNRVQNNQN